MLSAFWRISPVRLRLANSILSRKFSSPSANDVAPPPPPYNAAAVESKWQSLWFSHRSPYGNFVERLAASPKPPFYCLSMFPYPSGSLHLGHLRVYTIADCIARYRHQRGFEVFHPMGFDAFGLPAENAAIDRGNEPKTWTRQNIQAMKQQMAAIGLAFQWEESELSTCEPSYYAQTQRIFLELFHAGLAYQKKSLVNWDPVDQTVLANEQVDATGRSWRSGARVEKKSLTQWFLRTRAFADPLLKGLENLHDWPEQVKRQQRNWIGKAEGTRIRFPLSGQPGKFIEIFTTRPETLPGATFIAISPEHPSITEWLKPEFPHLSSQQKDAISSYLSVYNQLQGGHMNEAMKSDNIARGIFTGFYAQNPLFPVNSSLPGEEQSHPLSLIPVYIGDYILHDFATGAILGVPAHSAKDEIFARKQKLENLRIFNKEETHYFDPNNQFRLNLHELPTEAGKRKILDRMEEIAPNSAFPCVEYKLRDWLVSRQRYWGCPIPMILCPACGAQPVPLKDLPVKLPDLPEITRAGNPLKSKAAADWRACKCPRCGNSQAQRETDTLDTFMDSSWYFLRYPNTSLKDRPFQPKEIEPFFPIPFYIGGIEHAVLHLFYSRFLSYFYYSQGLLNSPEPFSCLFTQGMVLGQTFKHPVSKVNIPPDQVIFEDSSTKQGPFLLESADKIPLEFSWEKMSKSKYNGIDPLTVIKQYGADATRLYILFKAPPAMDLEWTDGEIVGFTRWLNRMAATIGKFKQNLSQQKLQEFYNKLNKIREAAAAAVPPPTKENPSISSSPSPPLFPCDSSAGVEFFLSVQFFLEEFTAAVENLQFNVAIAKWMKFYNFLQGKLETIKTEKIEENPLAFPFYYGLIVLLDGLWPFAPHFASEFYQILNGKQNAPSAAFPDRRWPARLALAGSEGNSSLLAGHGNSLKPRISLLWNGKFQSEFSLATPLPNDSPQFIEEIRKSPEFRRVYEKSRVGQAFSPQEIPFHLGFDHKRQVSVVNFRPPKKENK